MSISPTRVLVVGGHPVILGVVRLACDALPNVEIVAEAGDGPAAVAAATSLTPELAVVVLVSERADGATVLDAMRLGVDAYLIKPDGLRRVGDAIRRVLDGERAIDPALEQAAVLELGRFARQARESSEIDASLTTREREILELLAEGIAMPQIGRRLDISPRTVETHVANLYRKLAVRSR